MSSPTPQDPALTPDQLREADALEVILARSASAGAEDMDAGLAAVVARVRSVNGANGAPSSDGTAGPDADTLQARRVAQRVLARTTQEDLGRRGDVGVVLRFVGDRLRDSWLLRVAAALLIVQLTLVPLVAWQVFKAPHSGIIQIDFEPSEAELARALEDLPPDEFQNGVGGERAVSELEEELERMALEEDLAEVRSILVDRGGRIGTASPSSATGRALQRMTDRAMGSPVRMSSAGAGQAGAQVRAQVGTPSASQRGELAGILDAEARLYLLGAGGGWEGLPEALENVASVARRSADWRPLAARTMLRAAILGVALPADGEGFLDGSGPGWVRGASTWLRSVGEAASAAEPADPYVQAWIAAIVQDS